MSKSEHQLNLQKTSRLSKRGTITGSNTKMLPAKSPKPVNLSKLSLIQNNLISQLLKLFIVKILKDRLFLHIFLIF